LSGFQGEVYQPAEVLIYRGYADVVDDGSLSAGRWGSYNRRDCD
jgi:hypothetical protein